MPPLYTHTWAGYESYSTRGLYIIPSTGVCMYFRTAGIVGAQKGATGRQGTRSHFQVGFRTARPLEGTSNDSDIAAREFKSLTPSGSLSTYTYRLSLTLSIHMCVRIHTRTHIYIYLSFDLAIDDSILGERVEKNIPNPVSTGLFSPPLF